MQRPRCIQDWLNAYEQGTDPTSELRANLHRLRSESPPGVWIHLATDAELDAQLAWLAQRAEAFAEPRALLAALPLYGVPYAIKDNIDIAGVATTAACPAAARVADRSAAAVTRLREAGAIWLGKTNLDQFATGLVGTRSPYGQPACVDSTAHISGGSSSGSAVAVAAGLVPFALGTDTAGSGRIPAAFNGIVGLKPTPGRVGTSGVLPACRSLDCVSVFAPSVADAAHVLAIVEGADADDEYSRFTPGPDDWPQPALRVGVLAAPGLSAEYEALHAAALQRLRELSLQPVGIDAEPLIRVGALLYEGPWVAERHTQLRALLATDPDALDPAVRSVVQRAERFSATDAFDAQYALRKLQCSLGRLWGGIDVLMVPSAPFHPRFDEVAADPVGVNSRLGRFTNFVNLLGWCALALPAGRTTAGLPFGVTFIAPAGFDTALARLGRCWEAAAGESTASPALRWPATRPSLDIAVVGAHLSGMPLNAQLREREAVLVDVTTTAPRYRLYALPDTQPPKPGLVRGDGGHAIAVEVWRMPEAHVGSFLRLIAAPLGLGSLELADGRWVHGFVCDAQATARATDISHYGGWRAYVNARGATAGNRSSSSTVRIAEIP